jgi:hypothetical protein
VVLETPAIGSTIYGHALTQAQQYTQPWAQALQPLHAQQLEQEHQMVNFRNQMLKDQLRQSLELEKQKQEKPVADSGTRLVKVFVVDPDNSLKVDDRMIYRGEEQLTDKNDQELFFEIEMAKLLTSHNQIRETTRDKKVKPAADGTITYLEPARIRDLRMQVVVLAQF